MASSSSSVNLLDMASSVMASAVSASLTIRSYVLPEDTKNARLKVDGTFVTDADYAAQKIITGAVQRVCTNVRILGEESPEAVAEIPQNKLEHASDAGIREGCRHEVYFRFKSRNNGGGQSLQSLPLASSSHDAAIENPSSFELSEEEKKEVIVDVSRVCIIIDPLDGTSSYAKGNYDAVSVLVSVNLDYQPHFGVICKPFAYDGLPSIMGLPCGGVYGGHLIGGGFIAGGGALVPVVTSSSDSETTTPSSDLPRAIISSSRSKGVVEDVCKQLGTLGVIHPDPMHISGAGEKSLRLVLRQHNEGLWFFPKAGTSLWDVAAADAVLRALGGKVTDKYGKQLDYSKSREEAENEDGVIACADGKLHAECMRVYQNGKWEE